MNDIKPGDLVTLKSDPNVLMTVASTFKDEGGNVVTAVVFWFDGKSNLIERRMPSVVLKVR